MPTEKMGDRTTPQTPAVATRAVLYFVFGFLAFVAITMAGLHVYLRASVPEPMISATHEFPQPRLQTDPRKDLARFESDQSKILSSYGWVDRSRGVIHIPITDATRIVAGRGARAYDGVETKSATDTTPASAPDSDGGGP